MSQFVCGISGETVEEPVVSQVSGTVYEKRLIHKWIQENGTDPGKIFANESLAMIENFKNKFSE